jgi:hypothetical protein
VRRTRCAFENPTMKLTTDNYHKGVWYPFFYSDEELEKWVLNYEGNYITCGISDNYDYI